MRVDSTSCQLQYLGAHYPESTVELALGARTEGVKFQVSMANDMEEGEGPPKAGKLGSSGGKL